MSPLLTVVNGAFKNERALEIKADGFLFYFLEIVKKDSHIFDDNHDIFMIMRIWYIIVNRINYPFYIYNCTYGCVNK